MKKLVLAAILSLVHSSTILAQPSTDGDVAPHLPWSLLAPYVEPPFDAIEGEQTKQHRVGLEGFHAIPKLQESTSLVATAIGNIAVVEDDGTLVKPANLFDLNQKTLRFTPMADGAFTIKVESLRWTNDVGDRLVFARQSEISSHEITLSNLEIPFAGQTWDAITVNSTGTITFGWPEEEVRRPRFISFDEFGHVLASGSRPMIAAFWHRAWSGFPNEFFFKQGSAHVTVTWRVAQRFRTGVENEFQATLHRSGEILLSYKSMETLEGVVGVFPGAQPIQPSVLSEIHDPMDDSLPPYLDILSVTAEQADDVNVRFTFTLRGPLPEPRHVIFYRIYIDLDPASAATTGRLGDIECSASVSPSHGRWVGEHCAGPASLLIDDKRVSILVPLSALETAPSFSWSADAKEFSGSEGFDFIGVSSAFPENFQGSEEVDFSSYTSERAIGRVVFEAFHHPLLQGFPMRRRSVDATTELMKAFYRSFVDAYDFAVLLTTFEYDGGHPTGAIAFGPLNDRVKGIGRRGLRSGFVDFGSLGRLQGGHTRRG